MNRTPQIAEQTTLGSHNGFLRGNRFKLNGVWFRLVQVQEIKRVFYGWIKNESKGNEKRIEMNNLRKLKVDEVGNIDPATQWKNN
jgi:hypothetical protein